MIYIEPTQKIVPLKSTDAVFKLFSKYIDTVEHKLISIPIAGYWTTSDTGNSYPDWTTTGCSSFQAPTDKIGKYYVKGAAHRDGADSTEANYTVIAVASVSAAHTASTGPTTSETDGYERDYNTDEVHKDANNNDITESIPYFYTKTGDEVLLTAKPKGGDTWPMVEPDEILSYPVWSVSPDTDKKDTLTTYNGATTRISGSSATSGTKVVTASCGNKKIINVKFIKVKFKKYIYKSWDFHDTCYLLGRFTDDTYDQSHFKWRVGDNAKLALNDGTGGVSYVQRFDSTQLPNFLGYLRFNNLSMNATEPIGVTVSSEELADPESMITPPEGAVDNGKYAYDCLYIFPQYVNLTVSGADEETYEDVSGVKRMSNIDTNEGTIGAFVPVNDNDTNDNKKVDRYENNYDTDLVAINITKEIDSRCKVDSTHPVTLHLEAYDGSGNSAIRIWKNVTRSNTPLIDGAGDYVFTSKDEIPEVVYAEAIGATAGRLTVSYSYNGEDDYGWYEISASDSIRLNGFSVDIKVDGLVDEFAFYSTDNEGKVVIDSVRPFEEFPGGELSVVNDGYIHPVAVTFNGANLTRDQSQSPTAHEADLDKTATLTWTDGKIGLYEALVDDDGDPITDDDGNELYEKLTSGMTIKVRDLPQTLYINAQSDSDSKRDIEIKMSYTSPQNGATHEDVVKLTNLLLDLDVDSNNDGEVSYDDPTEDKIETTAPGKLMMCDNNADLDGDGITDSVDYNIGGGNIFSEMKLRIPKSIDRDNCKIKISYAASAPPATESGTLDSGDGKYLRIWTKQSNATRNPKPIGGTNQTGDVDGDYVMPTSWTVADGQEAYYTPAQLGISGGEGTFWVEGVTATNGAANITVSIEPIEKRTGLESDLSAAVKGPENYNLSDTVAVTVVQLDMTFTEADFTGGNTVPKNKQNVTGLGLVLNNDFDGGLEGTNGKPQADNSDNIINYDAGSTTSKAADKQDLGKLTLSKISSVIPSVTGIRLTATGSGKIRLFNYDDDTLFWDSAVAMTDAQCVALYTKLQSGDVSFYIEGYDESNEITLKENLVCRNSTSDAFMATGKIRLLKTTRWLVTHDPDFEKDVAKKDSARFQQASLPHSNKATIAYVASNSSSYHLELWRTALLSSDTKIIEADNSSGSYAIYLNASKDVGAGDQTDSDGSIYVTGKTTAKLDSGAGDYQIRIYKDSATAGADPELILKYPLKIGPLVTKLGFSPDIFTIPTDDISYPTVDPYGNSVNAEWDWSLAFTKFDVTQSGFGLGISYQLQGDLDFDDTSKQCSTQFINFANGTNGDCNDKKLLVKKGFLQQSATWYNVLETTTYSLKWEGFNANVSNEYGNIIYNYPNEAKCSSTFVSPGNTIKEGSYVIKVKAKYRYDTDQEQDIIVNFDVKYY